MEEASASPTSGKNEDVEARISSYTQNGTSESRVPESRKTCLQELVGWLHRPKLSKWCFCVSIALAVVVITALIIYTDYKDAGSPTPAPLSPSPSKAPFLKDYFLYHLISPRLFNGTFITGSQFYYYDSMTNILIFDVATLKSNVLIPFSSSILQNESFTFWFSKDLKYVMTASFYSQIYRHSFLAVYHIYNINTQKTTPVTGNRLQLVVMAPKTNALAYVHKNNIYYRADPEEEGVDVQLTYDGVTDQLYNGVPDWVYEEEILSSNQALWFSKNASYLAYFKFNDSDVMVQMIPLYGQPNLKEWQYTRYKQIHYPKVGTPNPSVSLHVVRVSSLRVGEPLEEYNFPPPRDLLDEKEPIASVLEWVNDSQFVVVWLNRYQNILVIQLCSVADDNPCRMVFRHEEPNGWLQLESPLFDAAGKRMAFIWWHPQSNGDSYPHVSLLNLSEPSPQLTAITSGTFSVTEIAGWNQDSDEVFFLGTAVAAPEQLHTYKVLAHSPHTVTCLSCSHQHTVDRSNCSYVGAVVSPDARFYALSCAGPGVPEVTLCDQKGQELLLWEDNSRVRSYVDSLDMPVKRMISVPLEDNFTASVQLILPPELADLDVNKDYGRKYPLLVNVYAGPDTSMVKDMFSSDFNTYMVANKSVVGVFIDGRGSNLLGQRTRYSIYKKLGQVEIADQLAVIKYLQDTYQFIDANHTASWGWSYGGFATGMMLAEDQDDRIKCGVSIAPVTDWMYYDSIYTERFMKTSEENFQGYKAASLLNRAVKLRDKQYFLIHGTRDDNVHFQNSMQLAKILATKDIPFQQTTYPDEDHGLKSVQPHFYHAIEDFLDKCLFNKSS